MANTYLLLGLPILATLYCAAVAIYRLFFHPLAKVPGPKLLAISSLPKDIRYCIFGTWYKDVTALHDKYGRVFRMGPNELAVDGDPGWDEVYGFKRNGKDGFMRDVSFFNTSDSQYEAHPNIFLTDREGHSRQRRILAHAFSQNALYEQEPIIKEYVDMIISRFREFAEKGQAIDVTKWFNFATFDIIGALTFGESFGCLEQSEMHPWVALIFSSIHMGELIRFILKYPFTNAIVMFFIGKQMSRKRGDHWAMTVEKAERRIELGPEGHGKKDFMWYILKHNDEKGMSKKEMLGNSEALIVAGSETTATALSGIAYYLGKNPHIMQTLTEEVRSRFSSDDEIKIKTTADLPYLQACIEEGLRMFPPAAITPPRVSMGDFVQGYYCPKGTQVTVHQYAIYHSSRNWHRPGDFCPERFLPKDHPLYNPAFANDNRKCFNPFSYGPTNCIGKNLAYTELRLILTRMVWNFDMLSEPQNDAWLNKAKAFTIWDKPPLMKKFVIAKH